MFEADVQKRRAFMNTYFGYVMEGYRMENNIREEWLDHLPIFLKLVEMDSILTYFEYSNNGTLDEDDKARLNYLVYCVENDTPYLGFYDKIYSHSNPFKC
jgi:hypothetical protein